MLTVDPRDFRPVALNNELIQQEISKIPENEKQPLLELYELKKKIRRNDVEFTEKRTRLKQISTEYQKVNEEYWNRGAGWNVEHLKVLKNKLRQEMVELSTLLHEPNSDLELMQSKFERDSQSEPKFELYEFYKLNYETFVKEVNYYSIFTLIEESIKKEFILLPEWVINSLSFGSIILLSEKTALGQSCYKRELSESFEYNDGDGRTRKFEVSCTRLISPSELDKLIHKLNVGLVVSPGKPEHNSLNLNNLGHLAAPVPLGGGGERRFSQLSTW